MAASTKLTFTMVPTIANLDKVQKEFDQLHLPVDKMSRDFKNAMAAARAEVDKLSKVEKKGIINTSEAKANEVAFSRLAHIVTNIDNTMAQIANRGIEQFIPKAELDKVEQLRKGLVVLQQEIDTLTTNKLGSLIAGDPALKSLTKTFRDANGKNITDAKIQLDLLKQQTAELKAQKDLKDDLDRVTMQKAAADTIMRSAKVQNRLQKDGTTKEVFEPYGRQTFFAELQAQAPDIVALMTAKMKNSGSIEELRTFLATGVDQAVATASASIAGFDPVAFDALTKAMAKLKTSMNTPTTKEAQLAADFKDVSDAALLATASAEKAGKAVRDALGASTKNLKSEVSGQGVNAGQDSDTLKSISDMDATTTNLQSKVKQLLGFGAILTQVSRMIRQAVAQVKELDAAMTQISVVTDFTNAQLWQQIDAYMGIAQQYGVTTTGVYQVSQLYYQQGLNTREVMEMTTETLKMAKIAGLDYAAATDYMTVAIRGFKLDVADAGHVVDVYSKLAAIAATDTRELAVAMSKTASIAESAGMSIESTSSFLTLMIETTREAPENLGTAMKTIIARFQEMKKSPLELVEVEGEEISLNKVDKALDTIGISLTDASGQFRDLDSVIFELSGKWSGLDRNTQRYIATTVAGSRQQSRFLALMSDNSRLTELYAESLESEDAALLQYAKTLDSIESKMNQLSTSFQQFYMSILNGPAISGVIDTFKSLLNTLNNIPKLISIPGLIAGIKLVSTVLLTQIARIKAAASGDVIPRHFDAIKASLFGVKVTAKNTAGAVNMMTRAMHGLHVAMGWVGIILLVFTAVKGIFDAVTDSAAKLEERLEKNKIATAQSKKEYKDLIAFEKDLEKAGKEKDDSLEAKQKWIDLNKEITDTYPELLSYFNDEGNAIAKLGEGYETLVKQKRDATKALLAEKMQTQIALTKRKIADASKDNFVVGLNSRDSFLDVENNYNLIKDLYEAVVANKNLDKKTFITENLSKYGYTKTYEDYLPTPLGNSYLTSYANMGEDKLQKELASMTTIYQESRQALTDMNLAITDFSTSVLDLKMFESDAPDLLKNNKTIISVLGKFARDGLEETYREDLIKSGKQEPGFVTDQLDFADYILQNGITFEGYINDSYDNFIDGFSGAPKIVQDIFSKKQSDLNLTEVRAALALLADGALKTVLEDVRATLDSQTKNSFSRLKNAGYTDVVEFSPGDIVERLPPGLQKLLDNTAPEIAAKIATQAIAIANAYADDPKTQSIMMDKFDTTINNITDPKIKAAIAEAKDLTSWYGIQEFIMSLNNLKDVDSEILDKAIKDFQIFSNDYPITLAGVVSAMDAHITGLQEAEKAWGKTGVFALEDMLKLIDSGKFQVSDFDPDTMKYLKTYEEFIDQLMPSVEMYRQLLANKETGKLDKDAAEELQRYEDLLTKYRARVIDSLETAKLESALKSLEDGILTADEYATLSTKYPSIINDGIVETVGSAGDMIVKNLADIRKQIIEDGDLTPSEKAYELSKLSKEKEKTLEEFYELEKKVLSGVASQSEQEQYQGMSIDPILNIDRNDPYFEALRKTDDDALTLEGIKDLEDMNKEISDNLNTRIKNAQALAKLEIQQLEGAEGTSAEYAEFINSIIESGESIEQYAIDGVYTMESVQQAAEDAFKYNKIDEQEYTKLIEDATKTFNKGIYDILVDPAKAISAESFEKYANVFDEAGITLAETVDGYKINQGPEEYFEKAIALITAKFEDGGISLTAFVAGKRDLMLSMYEQQLTAITPKALPKTADFEKILEVINETGVSAKEAAILINDLGFSTKDFYTTNSGQLALATGLKDIKSLNKAINDLKAKGVDISEQEEKQLHTLISLSEKLKEIKIQESIDFMSPSASNPQNKTTDEYIRILENASKLNTLMGDFTKKRQMTSQKFLEVVQNENMAKAIGLAFNAPADMFLDGVSLLGHVLKTVGADASVGGLITFTKDQAKAITEGFSGSVEAMVKGRIQALDAEIEVLKSLKGMSDYDIEQNFNFEMATTYEDTAGTKYSNFADFLIALRDTLEGEEGTEFWFTISPMLQGLEGEDYAKAFVDAIENNPRLKEILQGFGFNVAFSIEDATLDNPEEAKEKLDAAVQKSLGGNVSFDVNGRPRVIVTPENISTTKTWGWDPGEEPQLGDTMTVASQTHNVGANSQIVVTPITPDGNLLTQDSLNAYVDSILSEGLENALFLDDPANESGGLGLVLGIFNGSDMDDAIAQANEFSAALHNYHEAIIFDKDNQATEQFKKLAEGITTSKDELEKFEGKVKTAMNVASNAIKTANGNLNNFATTWNSLRSLILTVTVNYIEKNKPKTIPIEDTGMNPYLVGGVGATAGGTSNARAGRTLVGELGPELRVSNGKYSLVGAQGAEFVRLNRGDIIFDANRTQGLLNGQNNIRGQALAGGNSAIDAAIAQKELAKLALQNILNDLSSFIGGAGGSGGGGGGDKEYIMQLEQWFNWLRRIEQLESHLNVLSAKRENYLKGSGADGKAYVHTLYDENTLLQAQNKLYLELAKTQEAERAAKQAEILGKYGSYFSFVGDAIQINSDAILAATKDNKEFGDELDSVMKTYKTLSSAVEDNTVEYEKNKKQIEENLTTARNLYISMENEVLSALKNMYQKEIEARQKVIDEKIKANTQYVDALRKSLDDERKLYDREDKVAAKSRLQKRLALLQRDTSGKSSQEINSLREELRKLNQEDYFTAREDAIANIEKANKTEIDSMQAEVDQLTTINQTKLDNMQLYWDEVAGIINQGSEAVLGFLQTWSQTYLDASQTQQQDYVNSWKTTIDGALEYARVGLNSLQEIFDLAQNTRNLIDGKTQTGTPSTPLSSPDSTDGNGGGNDPKPTKYRVRYQIYQGSDKVGSGSGVGSSEAEAKRVATSYAEPKRLSLGGTRINYDKAVQFSKGGLVNYTGPAMVHGSNSSPESFFDAKATAALIEFTRALKAKMTTVNRTTPFGSESGNTGDMTVNIEVKTGVVTNSAQANALADDIFDKFTRLASKSGSIKVFRN